LIDSLLTAMLYYALTHWPEPLTDEYLRALSWEAATERFEAAGSISVAESNALSNALSASEAGVEVRYWNNTKFFVVVLSSRKFLLPYIFDMTIPFVSPRACT